MDMHLATLPTAVIEPWIDVLRKDFRLYAPVRREDHYVFEQVEGGATPVLEYPTTILPPKKVLLPQREDLFHFDFHEGARITPCFEDTAIVLFGVHTCDLHAIHLLDTVFSTGYKDQHYLRRRQATAIVTVECLAPCSTECFCKSMGTSSVPDHFDLHLTRTGDTYICEIGSEKGAALLHRCPIVRDIKSSDYQHLNQALSEKWSRFPLKLDMDTSDLPSLLSMSSDSNLWDELGERCLSCGACNLVCPTCYCFNVLDEIDFSLQIGNRYRVWDSCQLDRFATVAGGHNFRPERSARLRHRFFRKGKYLLESTNQVGCVGCSRCVQSCLVDISPVEVFNELYRRQLPLTRIEQEVAA